MNKKNYQAPCTEAVEVEAMQMLAGSNTGGDTQQPAMDADMDVKTFSWE